MNERMNERTDRCTIAKVTQNGDPTVGDLGQWVMYVCGVAWRGDVQKDGRGGEWWVAVESCQGGNERLSRQSGFFCMTSSQSRPKISRMPLAYRFRLLARTPHPNPTSFRTYG
jgi:hypothetical protein